MFHRNINFDWGTLGPSAGQLFRLALPCFARDESRGILPAAVAGLEGVGPLYSPVHRGVPGLGHRWLEVYAGEAFPGLQTTREAFQLAKSAGYLGLSTYQRRILWSNWQPAAMACFSRP